MIERVLERQHAIYNVERTISCPVPFGESASD
jgi:hypothetical protein